MKLLRIHATDTINKLLISHTFTILVDTNSPDFGWEEMNSEDAECIQKLCADVTSYYQQQITISSIFIFQGQTGRRAISRSILVMDLQNNSE